MVLSLVGVLLFAGAGVATAYRELDSRITEVDISGLVVAPPTTQAVAEESASPTPTLPPDPAAGQPMNILIIGSDSRADGTVSDGTTSVLADTHIVAHLSADRTRAELVSIPRDAMVEIPNCNTADGGTIYGYFGQFNAAFAEAWVATGDLATAIACDVTLVQSITGLTIDSFVLVEMGGFISMVDALGGVDICIPEPIDAPRADLVLAAGQQTLTGTQALGYARARKGVGDGSDTQRIERQQHLLAATVNEVLSRNLFTDAPALYQLAAAALGSLTTSPNLSSIPELVGLGLSLRSLEAGNVTFRTTPYAEYEPDPNRIIFTSEVEQVWAALREDRPIDGADATEPSTTAQAGSAEEGSVGEGSGSPGSPDAGATPDATPGAATGTTTVPNENSAAALSTACG